MQGRRSCLSLCSCEHFSGQASAGLDRAGLDRTSVVLRTPGPFPAAICHLDLGGPPHLCPSPHLDLDFGGAPHTFVPPLCVGMASSSHDIGFKRATLILFNVPYWKCEEGESLTTWWARIALPEELRTSIDDDDPDIIDFVFSERRIEGLSAEDLPKAHHMRGYLLQITIRSAEPETQRAHWHPAEQEGTAHYTQRYAARVCPALDFGAAGGQLCTQRQWLYKVLAAMPPESVQRLRQELQICCTEYLGQLALAQTNMTKNNYKQHRRRWLAFKDFIPREVPKAVPGKIPLKSH